MPQIKKNYDLERILQVFKRNPQGVRSSVLSKIFGSHTQNIVKFMHDHPDIFYHEGIKFSSIWKLKND